MCNYYELVLLPSTSVNFKCVNVRNLCKVYRFHYQVVVFTVPVPLSSNIVQNIFFIARNSVHCIVGWVDMHFFQKIIFFKQILVYVTKIDISEWFLPLSVMCLSMQI